LGVELKYRPRRLSGEEYRRFARAVMERDGWRCRNPWCGSRRHLEIHHEPSRSRGGEDVAEKVLTLCAPCHRARHDARLHIKLVSGNLFRFLPTQAG